MVLIAIFFFLSIFAGLNGAGTIFGYGAYYFAGLFFLSAMFDAVFGISGMFMSTYVAPKELLKSAFMFFVLGFVLCHFPKDRQDRLKERDNFRRK